MAIDFDETMTPQERKEAFQRIIKMCREETYEKAIRDGASAEEAAKLADESKYSL